MVFIDWQNFNISYKDYVNYNKMDKIPIDYCRLAQALNNKIQLDSQVIKTYLFASKPCDKLLELESYSKQYDWICALKNAYHFEVIEGEQVIRTIHGKEFDIQDSTTYTTVEKGTDVNVAVQMLSKGFQNAYDIAILVSGDTDYIPVVDTLHHLGKTVILATLPQQNIDKYKTLIDQHIRIDKNIIGQSIIKSYKLKKIAKAEKKVVANENNVDSNE